MDVLRRMDQQDVLVRRGLWGNKVIRVGRAGLDQPIVNAPILLGGKDVCADGEGIVVAVDGFEGGHGSIQHSEFSQLSVEVFSSYSEIQHLAFSHWSASCRARQPGRFLAWWRGSFDGPRPHPMPSVKC